MLDNIEQKYKERQIDVVIVDDQRLMLQGLSMMVNRIDEFHVVGTCNNGEEAVAFVKKNKVDVILMDIRMPRMNGVEATLLIKEKYPQVKIIILTTFNDDEYIFSSLKNGASGYLLKDATADEITDAIYKAYEGGTLIHPQVATKLVTAMAEERLQKIHQNDSKNEKNGMKKNNENSYENNENSHEKNENRYRKYVEQLTNREKDICRLLAKGMNNKEIGETLFISAGTVKNNITRILDKLELRDRTQLALFALKARV